MTSPAWVSSPTRWRHVLVGDVFYSAKTDDLWTVTEFEHREGLLVEVSVFHNGKTHQVEMDPDGLVQVLTTTTERDALRVTEELLGATTIERSRG